MGDRGTKADESLNSSDNVSEVMEGTSMVKHQAFGDDVWPLGGNLPHPALGSAETQSELAELRVMARLPGQHRP